MSGIEEVDENIYSLTTMFCNCGGAQLSRYTRRMTLVKFLRPNTSDYNWVAELYLDFRDTDENGPMLKAALYDYRATSNSILTTIPKCYRCNRVFNNTINYNQVFFALLNRWPKWWERR